MIATEKTIGRPTARQAGSTTSLHVASHRAGRRTRSLSRCITFSAITIDESTSTPIEMAMPASDMALAWMSTMPSRRRTAIIRNDDERGQGEGDRDDERGPDVQQDDQDAQAGRDHRLDHRAGHGADRALDQRRAVVEGDDLARPAAARSEARGSSP